MAGSPLDLTGRHVTLMGLGRHGGGLGAARFLAERGAIVTISDTADRVALTDSLTALAGLPIHAIHLGKHDARDFRDADIVVANPAVRPNHPCLELARSCGARVTSEIELFLKRSPARMIGVTGSNGKSTTVTMLRDILTAAGHRTWLGGNIGGSLLAEIDCMDKDDWVVVELSSFQLAHLSQTAPRLEIAAITNCTSNHLDWHATLENYAAAKRRLLDLADTVVLNPHDAVSSVWKTRGTARYAWPLEAVGRLPVIGRHNEQNAALAAAVAEAAGVDCATIREALARFDGLAHRLQHVGQVDGRTFYNDSKSTSPAATIAALEAVADPVWLLAGGVSKDVPLDDLARAIVTRARGAAFFGQAAAELQRSTKHVDASFDARCFESLDRALAWCWERSRKREAILLSPACASFDQFRGFEARGAAFVALVDRLRASPRLVEQGLLR